MTPDEIIAGLRQVQEALSECDDAMGYMSDYDIPLCLPDHVKEALSQLHAIIAAVEALAQPQELTEDEAVEGTCKRVFFDDSLGHLRGDDVRKVLAHYKAAVRG